MILHSLISLNVNIVLNKYLVWLLNIFSIDWWLRLLTLRSPDVVSHSPWSFRSSLCSLRVPTVEHEYGWNPLPLLVTVFILFFEGCPGMLQCCFGGVYVLVLMLKIEILAKIRHKVIDWVGLVVGMQVLRATRGVADWVGG